MRWRDLERTSNSTTHDSYPALHSVNEPVNIHHYLTITSDSDTVPVNSTTTYQDPK